MERHSAIIRYYKREIIPTEYKKGIEVKTVVADEAIETKIDSPILNKGEFIYISKLGTSAEIKEVVKTDIENTIMYLINYTSDEEPVKSKDFDKLKAEIDKEKEEYDKRLADNISKWGVKDKDLHIVLNNIDEGIEQFKDKLMLNVYVPYSVKGCSNVINENKYDFVERLGFDFTSRDDENGNIILTKNTFDYITEYFALEKKYDKLLEDRESIKNIVNSK